MLCTVAKQSAQLLEDFYTSHHSRMPHQQVHYTAVIPYFGKFRISRKDSRTTSSTLTGDAAQRATSVDDLAESFDFGTDPQIDFDAYFETLPGTLQPWQDLETDWTTGLDFGYGWSWSPRGTE